MASVEPHRFPALVFHSKVNKHIKIIHIITRMDMGGSAQNTGAEYSFNRAASRFPILQCAVDQGIHLGIGHDESRDQACRGSIGER
jgi:hypothetical protein